MKRQRQSIGKTSQSSSSSFSCGKYACFSGAGIVPVGEDDRELKKEWYVVDMDSSEDEKTRCQHFADQGLLKYFKHAFFHIEEVKNEQKPDSPSRPRFIYPVHADSSFETYFAAIGTTIYYYHDCESEVETPCVELLSREIRHFDVFGNYENKVCNLPLMNQERLPPQLLGFDGKLYVFGGTASDPWAEVFDPIGRNWTDLAQPTPPDLLEYHPSGHGLFLLAQGHSDDRMILVCSAYCGGLYGYKVNSGCWQKILDKDHFYCSTQPLLVGNTLYWLDGRLHAYDLGGCSYFSGRIQDDEIGLRLDDHDCPRDHPHLLHLSANDFCILWISGLSNSTRIHCTRVQVSLNMSNLPPRRKEEPDDDDSLTVSALSCRSYLVDHSVRIEQALLL